MTKNERISKLEKEVSDLQLAVRLMNDQIRALQQPGTVYGPVYPAVSPFSPGVLPFVVTCDGRRTT